jgi:hypothetical protein
MSPTSLLTLALAFTLTPKILASGIKINYYTDSSCTAYTTQISPKLDSCYNYQWGGTNSANIVGCGGEPCGNICECVFYSGANCQNQVSRM